jgi:hypothetical protein
VRLPALQLRAPPGPPGLHFFCVRLYFPWAVPCGTQPKEAVYQLPRPSTDCCRCPRSPAAQARAPPARLWCSHPDTSLVNAAAARAQALTQASRLCLQGGAGQGHRCPGCLPLSTCLSPTWPPTPAKNEVRAFLARPAPCRCFEAPEVRPTAPRPPGPRPPPPPPPFRRRIASVAPCCTPPASAPSSSSPTAASSSLTAASCR